MIYQDFQTYADTVAPLRGLANMAAAALANPVPGISRNAVQRVIAAICELIARTGLSHRRPAFGVDQVVVGNRSVAVREVVAHRTPFGTLKAARGHPSRRWSSQRVKLQGNMRAKSALLPSGNTQSPTIRLKISH